MDIDEAILEIAKAINAVAVELKRRNDHYFRIGPPADAGRSTQVGEHEEQDMIMIDFEENWGPRPPKTGNNADITHAQWEVIVDGVSIERTDVEYDETTGEATTKDYPWSAEKGKTAIKKLRYVDDELPPNLGDIMETEMLVSDTVAPDAPTEAGESTQVGEHEE